MHARLHALPVLVEGTGAHGEHLSFVELLHGAVRQEDAGCSFGLGLDALHEDAVEEGGNAADRLDGGLCATRLRLGVCRMAVERLGVN